MEIPSLPSVPSVSCHLCKSFTCLDSTYDWYTYDKPNRLISWSSVQSYKPDSPLTPEPSHYPVYLCPSCTHKLKLTEIDPDPATSCEICLKKYLAFHENCHWGYNCDSAIYDDAIICGFGSRYDDYELKWTAGQRPPDYQNKKIICDPCIDTLIHNNIVRPSD